MLPKQHIIASILIVGLVSFMFSLSSEVLFKWLLSAGIVTLLVDFDHLLFPLLKKEKRYIFKKIIHNPIIILKDIENFRDEIRFPGLGWIRLLTHIIFSGLIFLITFYTFYDLIIPIGISLVTHLMLDLIDTLFFNPLKL